MSISAPARATRRPSSVTHRERLGSLVDGDDPAALAGHELAAVVGGEGDDGVADGVAAAVGV